MRNTPFPVVLPPTGLAACSTTGTVTPLAGSTSTPLPSASARSVAVRGREVPSRCERLRPAIASRLIGAGSAERVVMPGQPADADIEPGTLSLDAQVTRPRAVPGALRAAFGAFAGRDAVTGTAQSVRGGPVTLRGVQFEAACAAHPSSGEDGVQDACRRFAEDVVRASRT